jgi:hypothetical protein
MGGGEYIYDMLANKENAKFFKNDFANKEFLTLQEMLEDPNIEVDNFYVRVIRNMWDAASNGLDL